LKTIKTRGGKIKTNNQLKLFVWHRALTKYTDCVAGALAHNVEETRKAITESETTGYERIIKWEEASEPEIVEDVKGFFLWGSDWKVNEEGR